MASARQRLQKRSNLLAQVRAFFYARDVLEVDTPILSQAATPDLHLASLTTQVKVPGFKDKQRYYLHTSPEYPMKRLLSEGSGDIFYLGKVFRDGDLSPRHQVEFTMLEWYRLDFSMQDLIDEVVGLLQTVLLPVLAQCAQVEQLTYRQMFAKYAQIEDVFGAGSEQFQHCLAQNGVPEIIGLQDEDTALWEQLVLTEVIEPQLGKSAVSIITHFPARDAALAQLDSENTAQALRFEVFVNGMELANGYQELQDAELYRQRFDESLQQRQQAGLEQVPLDNRLLEALEHYGLPACSGVALGFDRLLLLQQGASRLEEVIAYSLDKA
ncbi:EF-P lysine aminoacylase GenX [Thiomicrorhabdus sediminis]|uniref:EF-P lysine aminoacylase GenX n=2 Tax=Thiomicrorhabdus sediminis TaxID=2580412 RepID=A0A4P9K892_9GAMM|nr:EF-P lysine aminoacylase GenX [Thiomicrorhabdus sediminis]